MIKIKLPDGSEKEFSKGVRGIEIAESISPRLAREALGIEVNGEVWDLTLPVENDANVRILTWKDDNGKMVFWHSSAHLMAEALQALYPEVKFSIGPPVDNGFYYDVDLGDRELTSEELESIEAKMKELAARKDPYERNEINKDEAREYYKKRNNPYKVELIDELQDGEITFYQQGNFTDLCRGPHLPHTGYIKAIKLLNIAGAYWRGDERNKQLTRIYGITFPKKKLLDEYLELLEEAQKRDHRKLGKTLGIFAFSEKVGPGLPLWLPNGVIIREQFIKFLQNEQKKRNYRQVVTPHIGKKELYMTSGHYAKFGEDSFQPITTPHEGEEYLLKPMNCPHHCEIYKAESHSYRDLPLRLAEFGTVYRYEQSGELNGLVRARGFTQDDAHLYCTPDQLKDEFKDVIDLTLKVLSKLGFDNYTAQISLHDPEHRENYIGSKALWKKAENAIIEATEEKGMKAEQIIGEAAFYGPKLDFIVRDALNRPWQLGTIQVDYNLPERFDLEYVGKDNQHHRPVMIHRAPFGSMERFLGVLTEHTGGNFPLWLAPVQVKVLSINDKVHNYAREICGYLNNYDIRTSFDDRNEKIGKKIRDAEVMKIPYMVIIGEKEAQEKLLSVRKHQEGDLGQFKKEEFLNNLQAEIDI